MDDDWDLQAVVRGCTATTALSTSTPTATTAATISTTPPSSTMGFNSLPQKPPQNGISFSQKTPQNDNTLAFEDLFRPRNEKKAPIEDLCDLYKPFFYKPPSKTLSPQNVPVSPLSVLGGYQDLSSQQQVIQQTQTQLQPKQLSSSSGVVKSVNTRSKRRKNQMKRVCQVPAEGLSSDLWSWRKYGQKPIKGSPYPRGYYKCSTAKGCLARKQVERNRSDPNMFIVTYTAEHNHPMPTHRNSLAGITRQKPSTSGESKPASLLPESPGTTLSTALEKVESSREEKDDIIEEDNDDDDDDFGISDMPLDDDFFAGLDDELPQPNPTPIKDFPDPFPENGQLSWLANNATTTATSGGC